jgi:2-succinyl-5-enolpyruvyl-6-hydroxy-3-cyclohexene-1-carboxylate synthase
MSDLSFRRPVVLIGGLAHRHRERVVDFVLRLNAPVYAEALSGLREEPRLSELSVTSGERMLHRGQFDGVIRIGNVPTLRFWRDLDEARQDLPVISFTANQFSGLSRGEVRGIDELPDATGRDRDLKFFASDRDQAKRFAAILDAEPQSELSLVRQFSRALPSAARLYLGNSLPIREWDLAASRESRSVLVEANRGANGIDGQLSTFFGWCAEGENFALLGDLTTLYDLNAPWIVPQLENGVSFRVTIINNSGGRIFSRVPSLRRVEPAVRERIIENRHSLEFEHWAVMFGIEDNVEELRPDDDATRRVWSRYDELWS